MDEKILKKLLREPKEQDWFDFKRKLKLYQSDGTLADQQRDELIKDILGLANGNSKIVRKTKYLIIGVDDKNFDENKVRVLHNVDYKIPSQSDLTKWVNSACSPTVAGIECEIFSFYGINLFIVTIPPTFDLHETTRELNASSHFNKHTVFMRQDEHTVPASVRDGVTIQQLKHLHRQEIANPSAIWIGVIAGGVTAFIIGGAKIKATQMTLPISESLAQIVFTSLGVFFGGWIGWAGRQWNEARYDWRYMTFRQRIILVIFVLIFVLLYQILR